MIHTVNTHERLQKLMDERGWSKYRLSKECGLSESTLANIFRRNVEPSITTLELRLKDNETGFVEKFMRVEGVYDAALISHQGDIVS